MQRQGLRRRSQGRTVRRHRHRDAGLARPAPHPWHRVRSHAAGARPRRQARQRHQSDLQPALRDSKVSDPGAEPGSTNKTSSPFPARGGAVLEQMGGISGLIYSSLPVIVFVPISSLFGLKPAIGAALGVAALILVWRLIRRETVQPAISGFIGVGISALIAYMVGESKGYFLLGIWTSLFWAIDFTVSILIRRPVVGYIWGWVNSHDRAWRGLRRAVVAF